MKKLTIRLDENIHKLLKYECLERDISLNKFVTKLIKDYITDSYKEISATRDKSSVEDKTINKGLEYIKATMAYEDFELPSYIFDLLKETMKGKYTNEQARNIILEKHGLV